MSIHSHADEFLRKNLVGISPAIDALRNNIAKVASTNIPVLLLGETGVGKNHIAHLIHQLSHRAKYPFVSVNIAALPDSLATSELFGHTKGAFTGATKNKIGLLAVADRGTIFLDEFDKATLDIQRLLLRVLDTGKVIPFGSSREVNVDIRIIASTSQYPQKFDATLPDLFQRIAGFRLEIPSLRNRRKDIPHLIKHLLTDIESREGKHVRISADALKALNSYSFPGNIRELKGILDRALILSDGKIITVQNLVLPTKTREKIEENLDGLRAELQETKRQLSHIKKVSIPADPIWEGRWIPIETDYCFVLMPFSDVSDVQNVYQQHIKPVAEGRCRLRCERADDIHDISGIMQSVWESINRARFVIADLTGRNSNVFYELGIAHTLGKPVIIVTQSLDFVPFDLRHLRCIIYEYKPGKIKKFEESLEKTIRRVLSGSSPGPSFELRQE
ncbi:MAG: sigma-54-dependent Fis family transcriptional regulator [Planctomycetes bacterium]|uniref:sigma 54-interacting transcriptional regulator n=1 Tax=Candidatus Wunengus californicus TaxID=3367619 RepID=UPI004025A3C6|nr:sigma-54-dependent Fis family transcriptional regulator [Planctomycetota bacterium]